VGSRKIKGEVKAKGGERKWKDGYLFTFEFAGFSRVSLKIFSRIL
jgi:hypothetical protein